MSARDELPGLVQQVCVIMRTRFDEAMQAATIEETRKKIEGLRSDMHALLNAAALAVDEIEKGQRNAGQD